ncbi:MAG: TVP38/TMEM64 family protein [Gallicola sp.]|nr:TVP38/TMEM64 family protein [Gallicola sp.]
MPNRINTEEILENKRERIQQIQKIIRRITFVVIIAVALFLLYGNSQHWFDSPEVLSNYFKTLGGAGVVLSFLLLVINTIFPVIPGGLPALALYMLNEKLTGFLFVMAATLLGSIISFLLVKKYGELFVKAFISDKVYDSLVKKIYDEKTATQLAILAFLIPGMPDDATVMICGLTDMRLRRMILLCLIFKPLPTFLYLYGITSLFQWILQTFL